MRRPLLAAALLLVIVFAVLAPVANAEPQVSNIEVRAPAGATVGDHFHVVITLEAEAGTQVGLAPGTLPGDFSLIQAPAPAIRDLGNGVQQITLDLELAAFAPGEVALPPLSLAYTEAGGATGQVQTPATSVTIASVLGGATQVTPRGLKPQADIGSAAAAGMLTPSLAGAAAVVALALAVFLIARRRKPLAAQPEAAAAELGPEDVAREQLDRAAVDFAAGHDYVAYYTVIAVTVRKYLTERYGFHAFALTTTELRDEMLRRGIDRWQARLVDGLLSQCDAAVYARYQPALERADTDLTTAYELIEMSRPVPVENQEATPVA